MTHGEHDHSTDGATWACPYNCPYRGCGLGCNQERGHAGSHTDREHSW